MATTGRAIRQGQRLDALGSRPCPNCQHEVRRHFEYPREDARYRPLVFTCQAEGCTCEAASDLKGGLR